MSGRGQANDAGIPMVAEDSRLAFFQVMILGEFLLLKSDGDCEEPRLRASRGCATQETCLILPLLSNDSSTN